MKYLLDTSVYSQPLKKHPVQEVVEKWNLIGDLECCVSVFCEMELLQGISLAGSTRLNEMYEKILQDRIVVLPFTREEAKIFADLQGKLKKKGKTKPVIDLCIAATAIQHNLIVAALNAKNFSGIPGLRFETWA